MPRRLFAVASIVLPIAVSSMGPSSASAPRGAPIGPQVFRAQSDLVVLQVAVHDRRSAPVSNLTRDEFQVFEDRVPQDIRFFVSDDRPVAAGLVVDGSMSMSGKRAQVIAAAEAFARSSNPADALFTVSFNEHVRFGLPEGTPFTSDLSALHDALSSIEARGQTAMYDGLAAALDHVDTSSISDRVLIVVSDGRDNSSHVGFGEVLERAKRSSAVIYAVGLFDAIEGGDRRGLRRLAEATGGVAVFPDRTQDVRDALDRIATDIRHRYTIGYVSTNARRDGTFRTVTVLAVDRTHHKPLQVRARTGYLAPTASSDR
jgi:Ca-activated chloride channel family protein